MEDPESTTSLEDLIEQNKLNEIRLHVHELKKREIELKTGDYEYNIGNLLDKIFKNNFFDL